MNEKAAVNAVAMDIAARLGNAIIDAAKSSGITLRMVRTQRGFALVSDEKGLEKELVRTGWVSQTVRDGVARSGVDNGS